MSRRFRDLGEGAPGLLPYQRSLLRGHVQGAQAAESSPPGGSQPSLCLATFLIAKGAILSLILMINMGNTSSDFNNPSKNEEILCGAHPPLDCCS